jgi:cold-inducible RNA-binding protein
MPFQHTNTATRLEFPKAHRFIGTSRENLASVVAPFYAHKQEIRSLFETHGSVDRVNVVTDRDSGQARGFAFVEMGTTTEADQAISALNGTDVDGRTLNVNEARPKTSGGTGRGNSSGSGYGRKQSRLVSFLTARS